MALKLSRPIFSVTQTGSAQKGLVIFLHGSGDRGPDLWKYITHLMPDFPFRNLKILLPTAPLQSYTPANGQKSHVWFNRQAISKAVPEELTSVDEMASELLDIVKEEVAAGNPIERMIVGGFSMGGAMALHLALRHIPKVAGVFALSSFINDNSIILQSKLKNPPPLFQWHGARDSMVPMAWGVQTFAALKDLGISGEFHIGPSALHELKKDELVRLKEWIESRLPDL